MSRELIVKLLHVTVLELRVFSLELVETTFPTV